MIRFTLYPDTRSASVAFEHTNLMIPAGASVVITGESGGRETIVQVALEQCYNSQSAFSVMLAFGFRS